MKWRELLQWLEVVNTWTWSTGVHVYEPVMGGPYGPVECGILFSVYDRSGAITSTRASFLVNKAGGWREVRFLEEDDLTTL